MTEDEMVLWHSQLDGHGFEQALRVGDGQESLVYCSFSFNISPSNEHPGLISFRMDWLDLLAIQGISLPSKGLSAIQESSTTPQFKSINSSAFSFLYSPTLTSIHDYWKNHSFD